MQRQLREAEFVDYVQARRVQLRHSAYLLCGDIHRAEDLVQEALAKLYVSWPRIHAVTNIDAFVRRIIVNAHIDQTRRPWRRERSGLAGLDPAQPAGTSVADRSALVDALAKLPARQRRVVVLRHFWGLSVQETAEDLGCSPGTVKSQTSAALVKLSELLSADFISGRN